MALCESCGSEVESGDVATAEIDLDGLDGLDGTLSGTVCRWCLCEAVGGSGADLRDPDRTLSAAVGGDGAARTAADD